MLLDRRISQRASQPEASYSYEYVPLHVEVSNGEQQPAEEDAQRHADCHHQKQTCARESTSIAIRQANYYSLHIHFYDA